MPRKGCEFVAGPPSRRKNQKLIDARERLTSAGGDPWTPQDVADEMNAFLWAQRLKAKGSREPTTLDHRFVSGYESGRHKWPCEQYRAAFRYALRVETDAELGFTPKRRRRGAPKPGVQSPETVASAASRATRLDIPQPLREADPVQRRTLVVLLAGLAAGRALDRSDLARFIAGSRLARPEAALADHWDSVASEYGQSYLASPRQQSMRDLAADLAILELTFPQAASDAVKRALNAAGARIAALLAMACTDLGYGPEARHSWLLARRLSDASESRVVRLWVRGQEALLGIYSGRPRLVIERLTTETLSSTVDPGGPGTADLLAAQAQIFALQGRAAEALKTLQEVRRTFDRLPDSVITDRDSVYCWPEHRLRHTESFVHSIVGSARDATHAQDLALKLYPPSRAVSRCQIEMHRSMSLVRDGDVATGIRHATAELEKLPPGRRGRFVFAVAGHIDAAVLPSDAERPEVRRFRAQLSGVDHPTD